MVQIIMEERIKHIREWEEYLSEGMEAREAKDNSQWKLGDLASQLEKDYGEDSIGKYAYAIGVEKKTLLNYRTVSRSFGPELRERYKKLSFTHFTLLTACEKPEAWLEKADTNDWSVEHLRTEMVRENDEMKDIKIEDDPPKVIRCPECGHWRLEDVSSFEVCKGHYVIEKGKFVYK